MYKPLKLTIEEIQMLAEQEREMDSGKRPFVIDKHHSRWAVSPDVIEELGLKSGQSVSDFIITAILEAHLASVQALLAVDALTRATSK